LEYSRRPRSFSALLENDTLVDAEWRFYRAQDNKTFLDLLNKLLDTGFKESRGTRIKKVSVPLPIWSRPTHIAIGLLRELPYADLAARGKSGEIIPLY